MFYVITLCISSPYYSFIVTLKFIINLQLISLSVLILTQYCFPGIYCAIPNPEYLGIQDISKVSFIKKVAHIVR